MSSYAATMTMPVAQARPDVRATFIRRTYGHLALAVGAFAGLEALLIRSSLAEAMIGFISGSRYGWLGILGAFMITGWMARGLAAGGASPVMQYLGLALYVVAEAVIFVPLIYMAVHYASPSVLPNAAIMTGLMFAGLTAIAVTTRRDFSFLSGILTLGGFVALGLIICSAIFGFGLGLVFSVAMVGLASAAILYDTSKVLHHYSPDQHVAASLQLFASVALLFWYILRIMMRVSRR